MKNTMSQDANVIFVCQHGAAKSILAATYFNKMAQENNLRLTAVARGTHPDAELSAQTLDGLRADGLIPTESTPVKLDGKELELAQHVVSFCALPEEHLTKGQLEFWEDIPPVSQDYEKARDAIIERINVLLHHL
jgi:protein-tyrosine-phosphatase